MDTKICKNCGRELPFSEFHKDKTRDDGLHPWCKECRSAIMKQHYCENKERRLETNKNWRENNKGYFKLWREKNPEYRKDKYNEYYATIEGYAYSIRHSNLQNDRKYDRIGADEDPLPPLEYYIEQFSIGIDYYDGKKYPFNELGFDRIDNSKPHTIDNIVCCTTEHNKQRGTMSFEEFKQKMQGN